MNFDQRSKRLNTEVGLIIDSPEPARQVATRFEAMVQPENRYILALLRPGVAGRSPHVVWDTLEDGKAVEYVRARAESLARTQGQIFVSVTLAGELRQLSRQFSGDG